MFNGFLFLVTRPTSEETPLSENYSGRSGWNCDQFLYGQQMLQLNVQHLSTVMIQMTVSEPQKGIAQCTIPPLLHPGTHKSSQLECILSF